MDNKNNNQSQLLGYQFARGSFNVPKKDKWLVKRIAQEPKLDLPDCLDCFPIVSDKYLSDFIRGYLDGAGRVNRIKGNRINIIFQGNLRFLIDLHNVLKKKVNVRGGSLNKANNTLAFGTRDSLKIGQFMYENNPELFLKRKREKFYYWR